MSSSIGQGSIGLGHKPESGGGSGPPFATSSANNGVSVDPVSLKIVLGQNPGEAGNPAAIISDREIPFPNNAILKIVDGAGLIYGYLDPFNQTITWGIDIIFGVNTSSISFSTIGTQINGLDNLTFQSNHAFLSVAPPNSSGFPTTPLCRNTTTNELMAVNGASGSFLSADAKTVTVENGIVISIV